MTNKSEITDIERQIYHIERKIPILALASWNLGGGTRAAIIDRWVKVDEERIKLLKENINNLKKLNNDK